MLSYKRSTYQNDVKRINLRATHDFTILSTQSNNIFMINAKKKVNLFLLVGLPRGDFFLDQGTFHIQSDNSVHHHYKLTYNLFTEKNLAENNFCQIARIFFSNAFA